MFLPLLLAFASAQPAPFEPANRLTAIGVGRGEMSDALLAKRTQLMIDAQTFVILRDPHATEGAARVLNPKMQKLFKDAESKSGLPASLISAVAYLESWGEAKAKSPAGPKGVMQIAAGTAQMMGLRMVYATRYRTVTEKRLVKTRRGKTATKTVRRRTPYQVLVKDERLIPERAIPAAAVYLARLERRLEGLDWAVFA
jgi:Transglycosylase SLT domain